jgi:AcrR family transcriptional regulator
MRLLVADGYEALSIERVAAEAGVAKTTIYRRFPAKRDLVIAALWAASDVVPPTGSFDDLRVALERLVDDVVEGLVRSGANRVHASLKAPDTREPGLMDAFRARIVEPRRELIAKMLRSGVERGEVRADIDPLVVAEMLAGAVLAHHLVLGRTSDRAWSAALADSLWRAIAAPDRHRP